MKVPYIYVNGKCLNDEFDNRITKFEFLPYRLCVQFAVFKNGYFIDIDERYYTYDYDIKVEFKDI